MTNVDAGTDKGSEMAVFNFPAGYHAVKTLYTGDCCHLCGTLIKNVFWIKNDKKRWVMAVGSECVTHFGPGDSGQALAKKTVWEQNRHLLIELIELRWMLWRRYSERICLGYGRYDTSIWPRSPVKRQAADLYKAMVACSGKATDESPNGAVTRWAKKKGDEAQKLIDQAKVLVAEAVA